MDRHHLAALAACLILSTVTVTTDAARVYRWVDEEGVLHLSDRPPEDRQDHEAVEVEPVQTTRIRRLPESALRDRTPTREPRQDERPTRLGTEERCESLRREIFEIRERQRDGYGVEEGNRLERRWRELRMQVLKEC